MKIQVFCLSWLTFVIAASGLAADPPKPYRAVPSERQLKWHDMEFYGFLHFTVNTFTDREWGLGDEKESVFNPTDFDADQIVSSCKAAGMKGLILTCKHHDGFCLWPSKYTEHSVRNSQWKNGKGDVVRDISDACRKHGLKFGVYLSPWDRNHKDYGKPEYVEYYRNQLRELLTNFGPICEFWQDGANGGDGYYGGARETRHIDNKTYYGWGRTNRIIRDLQPDASIFSDAGPDCRWVGNESGYAGDPCWATITAEGWVPGVADTVRLSTGDRNGKQWLPAEVDVSIRPGWFYHKPEDKNVRSPENLMKIYFESVGRGANLLINVPPDRRGRVHENDVKSLAEFGRILHETFSKDLAKTAVVVVDNVRGGDTVQFGPQNLIDGNRKSYWATDDTLTTPKATLQFKEPVAFNIVRLREYLPLGQRVDDFALDAWVDGQWQEFCRGTAIGSCRLVRSKPITTNKVRLRITKAPVCPAIAEFGLFAEPMQFEIPKSTHSAELSSAHPVIRLTVQTRDPKGRAVEELITIDPAKTAIVVVDMWDRHWCKTFTAKVGEMVTRMNPALEAARKLGILVVFAPSDVLDFYRDAPQRKAMQAVLSSPEPKTVAFNPPPPPGPTDICECGPQRPCQAQAIWTRQHPDLKIAQQDLIGECNNGRELMNLCAERGIDTLLYMGVASNMCVLGRSMGVRNMKSHGFRTIVVADMVEAFTSNGLDAQGKPNPVFTPAAGTARVQRYYEQYVCPAIESRQLSAAASRHQLKKDRDRSNGKHDYSSPQVRENRS